MKTCEMLGKVTKLLIPEYYDSITWGNIWERKLESGTAFEWAVTAAIINVAKNRGFHVTLHLLETYNAPDYFVLRNEIPTSHGAQAGNSDTLLRARPLRERFLYCFVPKAILEKDGKIYSVFREGCPYHKVMSGLVYLDRTDIIIVPGAPIEGYPRMTENEKDIMFSYGYSGIKINGIVSAINSPYIPVKRREPRGGLKILPQGIVECSVNKTKEVATEQIERYDALFRVETEHPRFSIVVGNDLSSMPYDTHMINLDESDPEQLASSLCKAAEGIVKNFEL